jgi:hypothetical protein
MKEFHFYLNFIYILPAAVDVFTNIVMQKSANARFVINIQVEFCLNCLLISTDDMIKMFP